MSGNNGELERSVKILSVYWVVPDPTLRKHFVHSAERLGDMHALVGYMAPNPFPMKAIPP